MIPAFRLERRLFEAWRKRYGVSSLSSYERRSRANVSCRIQKTTLATITEKTRKSSVILFGDDRWVDEDRILINQILRRSGVHRANAIFLTDRSREKNENWPTANLPVRRIRASGSLSMMDRRLVKTVHQEWSRGKRVVIWTGALRATPIMIPRLLKSLGISFTSILLESPEARWKNPHIWEWGRFSSDQFVYLGRSPLLGVERFRSRVEEGTSFSLVELTNEFKKRVTLISRLFHGQKVPAPRLILHPFDRKMLEKLCTFPMRPTVRRFIQDRMIRGESAVLPMERIVLLSTLDLSHLSEESAHYARLAPHPVTSMGSLQATVEEAFGFLGSLCDNPNRKIPSRRKARTPWEKIHSVGYHLGEKLGAKFRNSVSVRRRIRKLWRFVPRNEIEALWVFSELTKLTR